MLVFLSRKKGNISQHEMYLSKLDKQFTVANNLVFAKPSLGYLKMLKDYLSLQRLQYDNKNQ